MADLNTLDYRLVPYAKWIYAVGKYYQPKLVVTSAFRSPADQQRLRFKWLTGQSPIPAAPPGRSLHNFGLAFDLASLGVDPFEDPVLPPLGRLWQSIGGAYGGVCDPVHFAVKR